MVDFFQRHGRRSLRPLRAKFWDSLVTGTSAPGPLANVPITRIPRSRHNLVTGTLFRCPKSVPVTSIYCVCSRNVQPVGLSKSIVYDHTFWDHLLGRYPAVFEIRCCQKVWYIIFHTYMEELYGLPIGNVPVYDHFLFEPPTSFFIRSPIVSCRYAMLYN